MISFSEYWKEKADKRRKTWTSKVQRFARNHSQLEDMRKEAYLPFIYMPDFELDDYKKLHFVSFNPIAAWQQGVFSFSEEGLRKALTAEGADLSTFKMEKSCESLKGKSPGLRIITHREITDTQPNKVLELQSKYNGWLKQVYKISTDMEIVHLHYGQISMTIKRYSTEGRPFGYYELNPCEQLTNVPILFQETDFYTFNVATMLMEAAAEWELRQEELNYYSKKLKLRTIEAVTADSIEFKLWDDKKLQKKIQEYIEKDYWLDRILEQVLRPWKSAIRKYIEAVTERTLKEDVETFKCFTPYYNQDKDFAEIHIKPVLKSAGIQDIEVISGKSSYSPMIFKYQGCLSFMKWESRDNGIHLYPNANNEMFYLKIQPNTRISAIVDYVRLMPEHFLKTDAIVLSTMHYYDELMREKEDYRKAVDFLDALVIQYAGKPVGKMMKYLRWRVNELLNTNSYLPFPIPTIKILNDMAFSYQIEGIIIERWLDADCHTVYASDPVTADAEARKAALSPLGNPREDLWSVTIDGFISWFFAGDAPFFSIDFIDQNL